jgi:hypothetical protein
MDTTVKLDLLEEGTRYDHYMELKEAFATGIVILENQSQYEEIENKTTKANVVKLKNAVDLIESRLSYLSDFNRLATNHGEFAKTIRAIPPVRQAALPECSESTRKECEAELRKAGETGYAEDGSAKSNPADKGKTPEEPK